jgi:hypothetical protein
MNAMFFRSENLDSLRCAAPLQPARFRLDRQAIAKGAALRRARAEEIEDQMDHACETAALGRHTRLLPSDRSLWNGKTWDRYIAEAISQARQHGPELECLRREAAQLDRLLRGP